jgi:hypothetical protein
MAQARQQRNLALHSRQLQRAHAADIQLLHGHQLAAVQVEAEVYDARRAAADDLALLPPEGPLVRVC